MNFDQTFIAIRERSMLEIFDLALHVVRDHFKAISILLLLGVIPFAVLDHLMIGWMLSQPDYSGFPVLYGWLSTMLVVSQAQVATAFVTLYLGQAMFVGKPAIWHTVVTTIRRSGYLLWLQATTRLVVPIYLCCLMISPDTYNDDVIFPVFLIGILVFIALLTRMLRPFIAEMLLLEQTPVSSRDKNKVNFSRRNRALHGSAGSELFGRGMISIFLIAPLAFCVFGGLTVLDSMLGLSSGSGHTIYYIFWTLSLWLVAGLAGVVRFLSYIDLRIRQEGWAVELRVRAESIRLAREV